MLTSDFNNEMGALIRSLEQKVRQEPFLTAQPEAIDALESIERAIVCLVALHIKLRRLRDAT